MDKSQAQRRVDQIRAFREELRLLEAERVLRIGEDQGQRVVGYHDDLLKRLAREFDVDTTDEQKQMSLGMKLVSFLGALALAAGLFFLFYQYWGFLSTPVQVVLLLAGPLAALAAMEPVARRETSLYFTSLLGLLAFASFVLNLAVLGTIFNITPSPNAFLVWSLFAGILAYAYGLRLLLVAGILSWMGYLSATVGVWGGCYWLDFGMRPENFVLSGAVLFGVPLVVRHDRPDFPAIYRLFGLLGVLLPILVLANWGEVSYLNLPPKAIENAYQILGFVLSAAAIGIGIRRRWDGVTNLGSIFFVIYLYTKLFQWWWDWMPKYLFFLLLGGIAVGLLLVLKKLRVRSKGAGA